jgi:hypothetical protein
LIPTPSSVLPHYFSYPRRIGTAEKINMHPLSAKASAGTTLLAGLLLLLSACAREDAVQVSAPPGEERRFSGSMTLTGPRQTLPAAGDRPATTFQLSGTALLGGEKRPAQGYRAEIIGYSDARRGMQASSVWTDRNGDRAFSELRADEAGPDRPIIGTFIGGTGRYVGLTGEYRFTWQYMVGNEEGGVGARVSDLQGWVRFAEPAAKGGNQ